MIRIRKLYPRRFAWFWNKDTRVLLIGLYWIAVGFDFGLKKSAWYRHFFRSCPVCGKELPVNHRMQVVKYHGECRREGRRMAIKEMRLLRKRRVVQVLPWWRRMFSNA